jgi:hypothetical protein
LRARDSLFMVGAMRSLTPICALAFAAACATAAPTAPAPTAAAPAAPSRVAQLLGAAGRADAPTQAEIERAMGAADVARQDGAGAALTYRLESCALLLLFTADAQNTMRLTEAHASARQAGVAAPSLETCSDEASARR